MTSIATDARPAIIGVFLLTLVTWLECQPVRETSRAALLQMAPPVIVPMTIEPRAPLRVPGDILEPGAHPDARAWPIGMVIRPAATRDDIQAELAAVPSPLDIVLSVLLGPWLAPAS